MLHLKAAQMIEKQFKEISAGVKPHALCDSLG
jgi:hypothetical protein